MIAMVKDDEWQDAAETGEMPGYGYWSANGNFQLQRSWVNFEEEEGLGRGDDDTFQEEAAENAMNRGGFVRGRGGTGKWNE